MTGESEKRSRAFLEWEARGRGGLLWEHPVPPEPPFVPFMRREAAPRLVDDGRRPTLLSSLIRQASHALAPESSPQENPAEEVETPQETTQNERAEFRAHVSKGMRLSLDGAERLIASMRSATAPISFELVAAKGRIAALYSVAKTDARLFSRLLESHLPDVPFSPVTEYVESAWGETEHESAAVVEFGLGREFVIPFDIGHGDPFASLVAALSEIEADETAVYQVLFSPTTKRWDESIINSVTHSDGRDAFLNAPELLSGAREKVSQWLYAVVVRIAVKAGDEDRMWEIATNIAGALGTFGSLKGNELTPLSNELYPSEAHEADFLARQSRRSGMILNGREVAGFAHIPSDEAITARLLSKEGKTKAAPSAVRGNGIALGVNVHHGVETAVRLAPDQRMRHIHVLGATGTGKSSLLFNMARQDAESGAGFTLIEPHGDLIDRVLSVIPPDRIKDVVLLDPADEESTIAFNILSARSDWEKSLLASDVVAVFRRNASAWGDQMESVLRNAVLAVLESERGGTLLDLRRFLLEPTFRKEFLTSVEDENVIYYWSHGFPALTGNRSIGPIITRLDAFLSPKPLRYMVGQRVNRLDFSEIMNGGKILLAKLSQGSIGPDNAHLLGSLIVAKMQAEAMARQRLSERDRRDHFLYIDEFHNFITPSMAETLTGARKYRLSMTLAGQELRQAEREPEVASALLSNAYTRIVFRVGDKDARTLESGFSSFDARDLQNLETGKAICRVGMSDHDFNLTVPEPEMPSAEAARLMRETVAVTSRARYGTPRSEIERQLAAKTASVPKAPKEPVEAPPPQPVAREASSPTPAAQPVAQEAPSPELPAQTVAETPAKPSADLGRGGAQHKAIQERIKDEAEKLGWRVIVEKEILGGAGQVDLVLIREEETVACEISVTTTIDHEVRNVLKCLKAEFESIAVIALSAEKLEKLRMAVGHSLGPEQVRAVSFFLPDEFIAGLRYVAKEAAPKKAEAEPETRSRGGRKIRRTFVELSPEETKAREAEAHKLMAEEMKKRKRKG